MALDVAEGLDGRGGLARWLGALTIPHHLASEEKD